MWCRNMSLEQKINYQLNKFPKVKKVIKRAYQYAMYAISPKIKSQGDITRISPDDSGHEYFFGYYDKSPWDIDDRYVLCMRADDTWSDVSPKKSADILLIDTKLPQNDQNRVRKIAQTHAWNVQQACMLQWLGPDFKKRIIYNDFRQGKYCSVVKDLENDSERIIQMPVYTVSADGKTALSLDFSRLYNLRPGYGYYNEPEATEGVTLPDSTAIWKIDLESGAVEPLLKYTDFANFQPRVEMQEKGSVHKVNHLMLSPNGKRFMVLYRWFNGQRKYTRLITCNTDGTDMYLLSDDDMVSHCYWKDDKTIIAFENKHQTGPGYYLMKDKTSEYTHCWPQFSNDGHPSYSPDKSLIVTDSYPNRARIAEINIMSGDETRRQNITVARVFAPFKYDNDTRCDLHPRWNHAGDEICFDSVFEGHRGLYSVKVKNEFADKIKVAYLMTSAKKSGPVQQMLNIIKNLDRNKFEPVLVTIYNEDKELSQLEKYLPYVKHYKALTGKIDVMTGRTGELKKLLAEIKPDVIHSLGVFPDYAVSRIKKYTQIITLRNYVWDDYPAKFGKLQGTILAKMHLYAMKHTAKTVACSESLSKIYKEKLHLEFDYIRNGVDVEQYEKPKDGESVAIRKELNLPEDAFIFVYAGQVIERKNQRFLLEVFRDNFKENNTYLLLLGDGADYQALKNEFGNIENIDMRGNVSNVNSYLKACDAYVSTSKSEGMPNGVLEAMATGLPVVLSDIDQHNEVINVDSTVGFTYAQGNKDDLTEKMQMMISGDHKKMGSAAYTSAHENFSASGMSKKYQDTYLQIAAKK